MRKLLPMLMLVVLLGPGCQHVQTPVVAFTEDGQYLGYKGGEGLVARSDSPIPDVPMPVGFRPVISQSSSAFDGLVRSVNHTYQGRSNVADTVAFYRGHLALHDWQFVSRTDNTDGSTTLRHVKGGEQLEVYVRQGTLARTIDSSVTTIVITIGSRTGA